MPSAVPGAHMAGAGGSCRAWKRIGSTIFIGNSATPHAAMRLKRCGHATYAVGNAAASSEQMTRGEKERAKQQVGIQRATGIEPMKRFLLATVSMVALTSVGRAADLPAAMPAKSPMYTPAPVVDWTGAYLGVQGGVVRREASFNGDIGGADTVAIGGTRTGGTIGALVGYSWQQGIFVYGLEGDWSWTGARFNHLTPIFDGGGNVLSASFDGKWLATLRGRIGLAFDSTLVYLTGGAAFHRLENTATASFSNGTPFAVFTQDQTKTGWTVGAGVEYTFSPHWIARGEFRYVDLGKATAVCSSTTNPTSCATGVYRGEFSNTLKLGLVGLAYKF